MPKTKKSEETVVGLFNLPHSNASTRDENITYSYNHEHGMIFQTALSYYLETARFFHRHLQENLDADKPSTNSNNVAEINVGDLSIYETIINEYSDKIGELASLSGQLKTEIEDDR